MTEVEEWLKTCHFCHKPIYYGIGMELIGSYKKKIAYHEHCYESHVLNFGTEAQRQDYFKMREI